MTREELEGMGLGEIRTMALEIVRSRRAFGLRSNPDAALSAALRIAEIERDVEGARELDLDPSSEEFGAFEALRREEQGRVAREAGIGA